MVERWEIPGKRRRRSDRERHRDLVYGLPLGEVWGVEKRGSKRIVCPPTRVVQDSSSPWWVHVKERKARDGVLGQQMLSDTRRGYELVMSSFEDMWAPVYRASVIIKNRHTIARVMISSAGSSDNDRFTITLYSVSKLEGD